MSEDNESETASLSEDDEYFDPVDSEFDIQFALTSSSSFNWNIDLIQGPQQTVSEQNDYPNEAYKGFVKIIEKHGLSNKAGDAIIRWFNKEAFRMDNPLPKSSQSAREYMLQFKTPNMNFQKELIGNFNGIEYYLEYRHISEALRELLMNSNLVETMQFEFNYKFHETMGREYSEMFNCKWWESVQASLPKSAGILSLMLYSDMTNCDIYGKTNRHPIFLTLGNIPLKRRNKPDGKAFIGFLPIPIAHNQVEQQDKNFQLFAKHLFHKAIATILSPLKSQYDNGFYIYINNQPKWCYIFISAILTDLLESAAYCLTSKSANARHPCHSCIIQQKDLNNIQIQDFEIILRTPETMNDAVQNQCTSEISLTPLTNPFWDHP